MCAVCSRRRQDAQVLAYALLIAAAVLFFCSKSSFGYPINDWSDANIYFTIGKGMTRGQVVYRDLYDHKGPLLYALHALCALISQPSQPSLSWFICCTALVMAPIRFIT